MDMLKGVKNSIILLIFSIFLFVLPSSVNGDAALINRVCGKTSNPRACRDCFNTNPRSKDLNVKELANTALYCVNEQSMNLQSGLDKKIAMKYDSFFGNQFVQRVYKGCSAKMDNIGENMAVAINDLGNGNKVTALKEATKSVGILKICYEELVVIENSFGEPYLPLDLQDDYKRLNGFTTIAPEVVRQV